MNKIFKTTLIAAAITAATSTAAFAATLTIGAGSTISQEGAASETSITLPDVTVTLGDEYAVNDRLILTIGGATVASQASATLTNASGVIQSGKLASTNANQVVFRITSLADDGSGSTQPTTGETIVLSGITLTTSTVVDGGNVTVSYAGTLSDGTAIESTAAANAIVVTKQFGGSVTAGLDGTIDVNSDRQAFVSGTTDTVTITPTEVTGLSLAAAAGTLTNTLWGDFSYVDLDGDGAADVSFTVAGTDDNFSAVTVAADFMSASYAQGVSGGIDASTLTVNAPGVADGNPTMEKQTFTFTSVLDYTDNQGEDGSSTLLNASAAGEWDLNGAQFFVPYLPVGYNGLISRVILANDGLQDGEIEVEAFDEAGNAYAPVTLATVLAGGSNVTLTDAEIKAALGVAATTKLSVTITVNAPAADVSATGYTQKAGTGRQLISVE